MLADPFEPPHKVAEFNPQPLGRVHVDLVDAVPAVVSGPLAGAVANGRVVYRVRPHPVLGIALVTVTGAALLLCRPQGQPDL